MLRRTVAAQFAAQSRVVADAEDNYRLTEARYREGIENFLATLVAQRTLYSAQQSLTRTRLERATNLADLYRTLGGDALIDTGTFAPTVPASTR
jgi:multidrug efflux system outer membrane protein